MKTPSTLKKVALYIVCAEVLVLALLVCAFFVPFPGHVEMRIVQSGSMEPNIPVGAVVLVAPRERYEAGDAITFVGERKRMPTTHRITETVRNDGSLAYVTKGDANEEADRALVSHEQVLGGVVGHVPRLGYIFDFAASRQGFLFMAVIPAALVMLDEILAIVGTVAQKKTAQPLVRVRPVQTPRRRAASRQRAPLPRARLDGVTVVLRPV